MTSSKAGAGGKESVTILHRLHFTSTLKRMATLVKVTCSCSAMHHYPHSISARVIPSGQLVHVHLALHYERGYNRIVEPWVIFSMHMACWH